MSATSPERTEYLLGYSTREWDRLVAQHALWRDYLLSPLADLGLGPGSRVLEVGCGTGGLLAELAEMVGRTGVAAGLELDRQSAEVAGSLVSDLPQATVHCADLMRNKLGGPWDFVVARWVLSFIADTDLAVARLAGALNRGGYLVVHDYNHDGFRLFPACPPFDRVVEAVRKAYALRGGDLWVAGKVPGAMREAGLFVERIDPTVLAGEPHSPVWRWVERFLMDHLQTLIDLKLLSEAEATEFRAAWAKAAQDPRTVLFGPMQVVVAGRRPR